MEYKAQRKIRGETKSKHFRQGLFSSSSSVHLGGLQVIHKEFFFAFVRPMTHFKAFPNILWRNLKL